MRKTPILLAAALLLSGAGCAQTAFRAADDVATGAVAPVAVPVKALDTATKQIGNVQATLNRNAGMAEGQVVRGAFVKLENDQLPHGALLGSAFGCSDRVAFTDVNKVSDAADVAKDALISVLAIKESNQNGLYNALARASLEVSGVSRADDGTYVVRLRGMVGSTDSCEVPRIKAQVEETVRRLEPKFRIELNGNEANWRCLGDQTGECK